MAMQHEVAITLRGGTVLDTWSRYRVTLDMLAPGSPWTFELYASEARSTTLDVLTASARAAEQLNVWIDGAVQLVGTIETRVEESPPGGFRVVLGGRDLGGMLMALEADPRIQVRGAELDAVLQRIVDPYRIRLFIPEAAAATECQALRNRRRAMGRRRQRRTNRVDVFRVQPGDSAFGVIKTLCSKAGYLAWTAPHPDDDTANGWGIGLVVDKPLESGPPAYALTRRRRPDGTFEGDVLTASYEVSLEGVPTTVEAFTHSRVGDSSEDTRSRSVVTNAALSHPLIVRDPLPRPHFLRARDAHTPAAARRHGERYVAERNQNLRVYSPTVQGHGYTGPDGVRRLWTVNSLCHVRDDAHRIDEDFLVTRVQFDGYRSDGGDGGQTTTLRLVPKGSVKVFPESLGSG